MLIQKMKSLIVITVAAVSAAMTTTVFAQGTDSTVVFGVIGSILDLKNGISIVAEAPYGSVDACWTDAIKFNLEGIKQGFVMVCWPATHVGTGA